MADTMSLDVLGVHVLTLTAEVRDLQNRFTAIEGRFSAMETRFTAVESRIAGIETRFSVQEDRMSRMLSLLVRIAEHGVGDQNA